VSLPLLILMEIEQELSKMQPKRFFPKSYFNRYFGPVTIRILVADFIKSVYFVIEQKVVILRKEIKRYG
jgi:hypothetical protein